MSLGKIELVVIIQLLQAEISDRNAHKIMAEGHNQHIRIFVMGDKNTINESISAAEESAETLLRNNKRVTNLKVEKADDKFTLKF